MEKNVFLNDEDAGYFRKEIKEAGRTEKNKLRHVVPYVLNRTESSGRAGFMGDIGLLHGINPSIAIKEQLEKREQEFRHRKFKILDMGGGSGAYADQLQDMFGDRVKIYTTGLVKKSVKTIRQKGVLLNDRSPRYPKRSFPPEYIKWRSILELNKTNEQGEPLEEFDFIINSYGEIPYGSRESEKFTEVYLKAIIAKLRPGGIAYISPIFTFTYQEGPDLLDTEKLNLLVQKISESNQAVNLELEEIDKDRCFRLKIYKKS